MAAGVALGIAAPGFAKQLAPVSNIFLRLIRSIIAPLLFGTLVVGIAGGGDMKQMGRIGGKAILYFEIVTTLALFLGLAAVNLVRPGEGVTIARTAAEAAVPAAQTSLGCHRRAHLPHQHHRRHGAQRRAADRGLRLSVRRRLRGHRRQGAGRWSAFCTSLAEVMFRFTRYVMYLAPIGVGAAIAVTVGSKGRSRAVRPEQADRHHVRRRAAVHPAGAVARRWCCSAFPLGKFYRAVREPFLIGFSTASSEAALPLALENMEQFGVPKHIVGFVIPTGYSFNLVGTRCIFRWPRSSWRRPPA